MVLSQSRQTPTCRRLHNVTTEKARWIVLEFGEHIGSKNALTQLTFQVCTSKIKFTVSQNDVIFFIFRSEFLTVSLSFAVLRGASVHTLATHLYISPSIILSNLSFMHSHNLQVSAHLLPNNLEGIP